MRVRTLDPAPNAPSSVAAEQVLGSFQDRQAIVDFARGCDVVTVEIEHVNAEALEEVQSVLGINVQPSPETLKIIQVGEGWWLYCNSNTGNTSDPIARQKSTLSLVYHVSFFGVYLRRFRMCTDFDLKRH